jgi:hypothetical protein
MSTKSMTKMVAAFVAAGTLAGIQLSAQAPAPGAAGAAGTWTVPRTPDGRPDLQGVWSNNSVTPLERPTQWKDKASLTDAEVEELKALVARYVSDGGDAIFGGFVQIALDAKDKGEYKQTSYDPTTGNYNHFWIVDRDWDNRTSLITDPPNGMMPAMTPEAEARRARGRGNQVQIESSESGPRGRLESHEVRPLGERCVHFPVPRLSTGYNSYMQIVQSPEYVVIYQEMAHDARVVPMDGRPHLPADVKQWGGSSRGRWEGDTLVVETTNYSTRAPFERMSPNGRLIERFTRVSADFINYEVTLDDPATWVQPWTRMIRLRAKPDEQVYEYACHEGNYSMEGILAGARAEEKEAAQATAGPTSK